MDSCKVDTAWKNAGRWRVASARDWNLISGSNLGSEFSTHRELAKPLVKHAMISHTF